MDFKTMSDSELATVVVNYISRIEYLADLISKYIQGVNRKYIQEFYPHKTLVLQRPAYRWIYHEQQKHVALKFVPGHLPYE